MPWEKPADGARRAVSSSSSISVGSIGSVGELPRHPPAADECLERRALALLAQRLPSSTRSSAITQPWAISEPPLATLTLANSVATSGLIFSGRSVTWSMNPLWPLDLTTKRLLVVLPVDAEALRQPPTPRPLLADGAVAGPGDQLVERLERLEAVGGDEARADDDVLVGEGHQRPMVRLVHQSLEHLVTLGGALHAHQTDQHARRAADALQRREREPVELVLVAGDGAQHPVLFGLRQHADVERTSHRRHLVEIGVGQRCAVPRLHFDRHWTAS